ncbi:guanylate kinase [Pontivivens insulae]|uniref:Guanylate kinase n=1 Tax=Pontivivens insulae TaxID=1639689 RepID=A0A2R8AC06_9RHOB|nr:guanylate kinase [Pontivivens insulae]RED11042.1 guanylate kinase [Pontivivens insulae]SPF29783.1 Guanylate kinase [Pontivivens insulae]
MTQPSRRGLLVILSSPSGAGKSTLSRRLLADFDDVSFSVSATTRAPREGEVDGREYHFRSREQFERLIAEGKMLEHAEVFDNYYGSPLEPVRDAMIEGKDVLFDVDWQGGQQIRNSEMGREAISIFILPPSIEELERRLRARAQDAEDVIKRRMDGARREMRHWAEYDYILINDDLDACYDQLRSVLMGERLRRDRRPDIAQRARQMSGEIKELSRS